MISRYPVRRNAVLPAMLAVACAVALALSACGATPTATAVPVPPTATKASAPAAQPTATSAPAAAQASFAKDVLPIFQKYCTSCHGSAGALGGHSLDTYQNVIKGGKIVPGNADRSLLYDAAKRGAMPPAGAKLTAAELAKVAAWINAGAPDN